MLFDTLLTYVILRVCLYSGTWRSQGRNVNAIGIFVAEIYDNFKFASTSNIYGFGILILTLYCVIRILPKITSVLCFNPTNPLLNTTEKLGRNDPGPGADRPWTWGGTTALGADVGRNDPGRIDSGAYRLLALDSDNDFPYRPPNYKSIRTLVGKHLFKNST